ncbi:hypothetical protein NpPPO83_00003338 [Neofusicoccum parvum]|uniref:Uncharacterized protein n=1 Tax=Neofusicoccum parvum TaxID=310453 RepID=A0ACB5SQR0_9PEZI|nr:hypothetical protein NpPPO83_00003338 [Neofusicoccum parvum]
MAESDDLAPYLAAMALADRAAFELLSPQRQQRVLQTMTREGSAASRCLRSSSSVYVPLQGILYMSGPPPRLVPSIIPRPFCTSTLVRNGRPTAIPCGQRISHANWTAGVRYENKRGSSSKNDSKSSGNSSNASRSKHAGSSYPSTSAPTPTAARGGWPSWWRGSSGSRTRRTR